MTSQITKQQVLQVLLATFVLIVAYLVAARLSDWLIAVILVSVVSRPPGFK